VRVALSGSGWKRPRLSAGLVAKGARLRGGSKSGPISLPADPFKDFASAFRRIT
jgi:hypothetical protein